MRASSTGRQKTAPITARLDEADLAQLAKLAVSADRSLSAELRQAVRFYIAAHSSATEAMA